MILFENCCYCVPLKTGCFIIGILDLIGAVVKLNITICVMIHGVPSQNNLIPKEFYAQYNMVVGMGVVLSIMLMIGMAFSIVLLIGIKTDQPGHVKAYLMYNYIFLILCAILLPIRIIHRMSSIFSSFVDLGINIYLLLVIRSYYVKMQEISNLRAAIDLTESQKV